VNSLIEHIKYQKVWLGDLEGMDRSRLSKLVFSLNPGDDEKLEDPGRDGKFNNSFSFKGADL
jgi:hypothetical protein